MSYEVSNQCPMCKSVSGHSMGCPFAKPLLADDLVPKPDWHEQLNNLFRGNDKLIEQQRERIAELERQNAALRKVVDAKFCPYCQDVGWYEAPNPQTGEGEQQQCQWCYETPDSRFNAMNELSEYEEGK